MYRYFKELEMAFENAILAELELLDEQISLWDEDKNPEKTIEQLEDDIEHLNEVSFSINLIRNENRLPESVHRCFDERLGELLTESGLNISPEEFLDKFEKPIFQIRDGQDGTWSVMARVWTPQKAFYEHPRFINLTKDDAEEKCKCCIQSDTLVWQVEKEWTYIGS